MQESNSPRPRTSRREVTLLLKCLLVFLCFCIAESLATRLLLRNSNPRVAKLSANIIRGNFNIYHILISY
jgi:hypothetical protein